MLAASARHSILDTWCLSWDSIISAFVNRFSKPLNRALKQASRPEALPTWISECNPVTSPEPDLGRGGIRLD